MPYELATLSTVSVSRRCRVRLDANHYSVPPRYADTTSCSRLIPTGSVSIIRISSWPSIPAATSGISDFEKPEHVEELLAQRRQARAQQLLTRFLALSPEATEYYQRLEEKRGNARHHAQKIVALSEIYGVEKVQRALEDAWAYQAFSCEYIANLLEQRERPVTQPGALHLTRQQDLLDLDLPAPDFSLYEVRGRRCAMNATETRLAEQLAALKLVAVAEQYAATGLRGRAKTMAACGLSGPAH